MINLTIAVVPLPSLASEQFGLCTKRRFVSIKTCKYFDLHTSKQQVFW